jgi:hypothetical protein
MLAESRVFGAVSGMAEIQRLICYNITNQPAKASRDPGLAQVPQAAIEGRVTSVTAAGGGGGNCARKSSTARSACAV